MGAAISDIQKSSNEEVKEQIALMLEMASAIMKGETASLEGKAFKDKSLPIVAVVDQKRSSSMNASAEASNLGGKVENTLNKLFSGNVLGALKTAITSGLTLFLGKATEGRSEANQFHVVYQNCAFLRIDIYFYKYVFSSQAVKEVTSDLFCYVSQVGVIDPRKMHSQVVLYELAKSLPLENIEEAKKQMLAETEFAGDLYDNIKRLAGYALEGKKGGRRPLLKSGEDHEQTEDDEEF
ncbi:uncharacterized protein LOC110238417 [Exaiptasia diaphana]|uniref:Uncharacterized protein n=1 Tax=Exaiptasia diaphana TaxID=2652724 RepID=A0A913X6K5_EXADI|nr:uncharacterized protein LOC110238417 [Exaiptasia diaphana]KXJ14781.1 hypothetical protein AC249_AIPGENE24473 [Exaiptasia diaphana]